MCICACTLPQVPPWQNSVSLNVNIFSALPHHHSPVIERHAFCKQKQVSIPGDADLFETSDLFFETVPGISASLSKVFFSHSLHHGCYKVSTWNHRLMNVGTSASQVINKDLSSCADKFCREIIQFHISMSKSGDLFSLVVNVLNCDLAKCLSLLTAVTLRLEELQYSAPLALSWYFRHTGLD